LPLRAGLLAAAGRRRQGGACRRAQVGLVGQALVQLSDEVVGGGLVRTLLGQYMVEYGFVYQPAFLGGCGTLECGADG
jgi:hypothetical protein